MSDQPDPFLMTPGPTAIPADVRVAMSRPPQNPDVDPAFTAFYRRLLEKLQAVYRTDKDVLVLGGEGMLGLEASVASLIEPGDRVLCLANGVFGAGFSELVELHGGDADLIEGPADEPLPPEVVKSAVETGEYVAATMVHCETPTGLLNELDEILAILDEASVLTIVDAVSSLGGVRVPTDRIDLCIGASQKCLSSPPGLTTLAVSDAAWNRIGSIDQRSFYTSLEPWRELDLSGEEAVLLPYTPMVSNLYALDKSLDRLLEEGLEAVIERHERVAAACRDRGRELGLEPFPSDERWSSPTVTAFEVDGSAKRLQRSVADEGIVLATGLGEHDDDVLRVGHMGYNATMDAVGRTMDAITKVSKNQT